MKNIIVVAHKYLPQPDDDLVLYLNKLKQPNVLHIFHSFNECQDRCSFGIWYKEGVVYRKFKSSDFRSVPEGLIYLKELLFTVSTVLKSKITWDLFIGMDGLCSMFGILLRRINRVRKIVYWAVDFVPVGRFDNKIKNFFYKLINKFSYRYAEERWDLSPRMAQVRKIYFKINESEEEMVKVVPYGMWLARIKRYPYKNCQKKTIVFMGHLIEKQGVQLVIKAIPYIVKHVPDFKFKIIGEGEYASELVKLAKQIQVDKFCSFLGKIKDNVKMEKEISKSCIALAPYIKKLDKWTYYADPGKVKTYLGCGVPVLLTNIPWNAEEIEKAGCGKIISEDEKDIAENIIKLLDPSLNQKCRNSAVKYSKSFDWENIFRENMELN